MINIVNFRMKINSILTILLVIYAFLLPLSSAFTVFTAPYIIFLLWIVEGNIKIKIKKALKFKPILFFLIFLFINILSLLWTDSENIKEGIRNIKYYIAILVPFIVIFTSLKREYLKYLISAFLLGMFFSEILLYGIFFKWWHVGRGVYYDPSPFMNHTMYSIFLASSIFILIWQILYEKTKILIKVIESLFLLSTLINFFLNGGRAGQLAIILAIFIFVILYFGFKLKYLIGTFISLSLIFFLAYKFSPIFKYRVHEGINDIKKMEKGNFSSSFGDRVALKIVAPELIKNNMLLGVGIGDDKKELKKFTHQKEIKKRYSFLVHKPHLHDQYLQILLQVGIIGFIPFLLFLISFFREKYYSRLSKSILYSILTIFIITFFIDINIGNAYPSALFGFLLGVLSYSATRESSDEE